MKKIKAILKIAFVLFSILHIQAQDMPSIKVGKDKLGIRSLDIKVEVVGNIATTTYDMLFYNPTNVVLEGELAFPLGEGQNVSRLALEVNGKLREAVVVEKELGRVAFEAVVRRGVDPVLLEKGTGNNYKARIYPIPARGYKRVILAHEQELILSETAHFFQLPLGFKKNLEHFSLSMNVFDQKLKPELNKGHLENFKFNEINKNFYAYFERKNFTPNESLTIKIPQEIESKTIVSENYFYVYKKLETEKRIRKKAKSITLYWDVSLSMQARDIEKEFQFLEAYITHLEHVKINLVKFSNAIVSEKNYTIKSGVWDALKMDLVNTVYDGGTSYKGLFNTAKTDEILLFSDGMKNLSDFSVIKNKPTFVINSIVKANHLELKTNAEWSNGKYINLKRSSINEAFREITEEAFKFMGALSNNSDLEIYPNKSQVVSKDFSITGRGFNKNDKITLSFGYGNEVTKSETISINADVTNLLVKRIWAQQKLNELQVNSDNNKEEIIKHAKFYNLVSNHTSLIVLESVWDYVKYSITPPEELLAEYNAIMKRNNGKKVVRVSKEDTYTEPEIDDSAEEVLNESSTPMAINGNISGTIVDAGGLPLPGVNIVVKGTSRGAQTDFDGNYSIRAETGETLVFSYIGFSAAEVDVTRSNIISFSMAEDESQLDEVVIVGYGTERKRDRVRTSVQKVKTEMLTNTSNPGLVNSLAGKVSGLQVTQNTNGLNSDSSIVIRGSSSISGNNEALIVIDGVISNTGFLNTLDPNNILSLDVIKGPAASTIYGSQGINGAIVITTTPSLRTSNSNVSERKKHRKHRYSGRLKVKEVKNNTEYIKELSHAKNVEQAYKMYLAQRDKYSALPAYYIDVYDFFSQYENDKYSLRILTNIAEIDFDNYELLRVMAYKLEAINNYKLASFIFNQVLKLRPEDAQSYRDLALAYHETDAHQKAFDLLNNIVSENIYKKQGRRKFIGMQTITKNEINRVLQNNSNVNDEALESYNKINTTFDLRVVIDWNHNDTDIDLHVIDPSFEECSYKNTTTQLGGKISKDMTQGFGPEEYTIRNAKEGAYYVKINYFGDNYQKIENPTFMKVTTYKNFGKKNETKNIQVIRLTKAKDKKIVARIDV